MVMSTMWNTSMSTCKYIFMQVFSHTKCNLVMSTSNLSISTCNILVCQHITYLCQNEILCVNMQLIYVDSQTHYFILFNITNDTFKMINSKTSFVSFFNLPICFLHENYSKYPSSIIPLELWLDSKSTRTVWLVICWIILLVMHV